MSGSENPQASALDGTLADLLDLSLLAKQAHWNVIGAHFTALHQLLEELAGFAGDSADAVAERAVTLGHPPDGRARTISVLSSLPALERGALHGPDAIVVFVAILDAMACRLYDALEAFEKDLVSAALFTAVLAGVERYAWVLRAQRE